MDHLPMVLKDPKNLLFFQFHDADLLVDEKTQTFVFKSYFNLNIHIIYNIHTYVIKTCIRQVRRRLPQLFHQL